MDFFFESILRLTDVFKDLAILYLVFVFLIFIVKGRLILKNLDSIKQESVFNIKVVTFNVLITTPIIFYLNSLMGGLELPLKLDVWNDLNIFLIAVITIFLGDFIAYWRHRFEHSVLLWPAHSMHHSDTAMTWITLERMHPINRLSTFLIDSSLLVLLGVPVWAIVLNNFIRHYYGYFIHLGLPWSYGFFGRFFVSPVMHQWHHALDKKGHNVNYTTIFSLIDVLFGTFYSPGYPPKKLGVASYSGGGTFLRQLSYPFQPSSYIRGWKWMRMKKAQNFRSKY